MSSSSSPVFTSMAWLRSPSVAIASAARATTVSGRMIWRAIAMPSARAATTTNANTPTVTVTAEW
ncbi:hypothetical protein D3C72_744410 [compost metagenome]